jgi:hypothetical protein
MFAHRDGMQLSAANLLIASQQLKHGVEQVPRDAQAQFSAVLATEKPVGTTATFEPIEFETPALSDHTAPAPTERSTRIIRPGQLGARLDIRV